LEVASAIFCSLYRFGQSAIEGGARGALQPECPDWKIIDTAISPGMERCPCREGGERYALRQFTLTDAAFASRSGTLATGRRHARLPRT
jgi:hypothetical protein